METETNYNIEPIIVDNAGNAICAAYMGWRGYSESDTFGLSCLLQFDMLGSFELIARMLDSEGFGDKDYDEDEFLHHYAEWELLEHMYSTTLLQLARVSEMAPFLPGSEGWYVSSLSSPIDDTPELRPASAGLQQSFHDAACGIHFAVDRYREGLDAAYKRIKAHYHHYQYVFGRYYHALLLVVASDDDTELSLLRDLERLVGGNPTIERTPKDWGRLREIELAQSEEEVGRVCHRMRMSHHSRELITDPDHEVRWEFYQEFKRTLLRDVFIVPDVLDEQIIDIAANQHRENLLVCHMFPELREEYESWLRLTELIEHHDPVFSRSLEAEAASDGATLDALAESAAQAAAVDLPPLLSSMEARELLAKAQAADWLDDSLQPKCSKPMASLIASEIADRLKLRPRWTAFEQLWATDGLSKAYSRALCQPTTQGRIDSIRSALK